MAEQAPSAEDLNSNVCEDQDRKKEIQDNEVQTIEDVKSDAIFQFLSVCLRQFSDYKSEIRLGRGAADGNEGDFKVTCKECNLKSAASELQFNEIVQGMKKGDIKLCRFCHCAVDPAAQDSQQHLETCCSLYPVCCPNMCGKMTLPREQVRNISATFVAMRDFLRLLRRGKYKKCHHLEKTALVYSLLQYLSQER